LGRRYRLLAIGRRGVSALRACIGRAFAALIALVIAFAFRTLLAGCQSRVAAIARSPTATAATATAPHHFFVRRFCAFCRGSLWARRPGLTGLGLRRLDFRALDLDDLDLRRPGVCRSNVG
jgi:hypothetical protein